MPESLNVGDRVLVGSGYDFEPRWLRGRSAYSGMVKRYIPGQNEASAAVVELDEPLTVDGVTGTVLVLELRYRGAKWEDRNTVEIELCDFQPEAKSWKHRRQGSWIESHGTCVKLPAKLQGGELI